MKNRLVLALSAIGLAAMSFAFVFGPQSLTVVRGQVVSGNLGSLLSSDNNRLVVRSGVRVTTYDNPIDILGQVVCGQPNPSSIVLRIEDSASTSGLVEYVEMWNWSTNRFEEVYRGAISTTETARQIAVPNGGRFTNSGGQMQIRYWVDSRGPVLTPTWTVSLDELTWDVNF